MQKKIEEARKPSTSKSEKEQETDVRCYNCGDKGDKAKNCKKKELGKKCQKYGHTAWLCNVRR